MSSCSPPSPPPGNREEKSICPLMPKWKYGPISMHAHAETEMQVNTRSHTRSHDRYARCNSYTPCHHELLNQNIMLLFSHCKTAEGFCIAITQEYHSLLLLLPSCIFFVCLFICIYSTLFLFCSLLLHLMLLSCQFLPYFLVIIVATVSLSSLTHTFTTVLKMQKMKNWLALPFNQ